MFVCEDCINKFEPVAALATFFKICEICGERRTCLDLAPNVKRIDSILELIIEHKDGKFINWSMRDPNDPTRKFGEDDTALVEQVIGGFPEKEGGLLSDPYGDGVGWACKCGHGSHSIEQPPNFCPNCGTRLKGEQKANLDEMWGWIDRDLDDEFFETAGKFTDKGENQRRINEIPEVLRPLVHVIIALAYKNKGGGPCILFRHELFAVHKELLKKGIDIHLPHAWFCDGVMIEPEWIVRITNGIVGWSCDLDYDNPDTCGLENCRYRGFDHSITTRSIEGCTPPAKEQSPLEKMADPVGYWQVGDTGKSSTHPPEEPKIPSDEFFDDDKRHEMELMGGAPEHLMDRAVPSIQKMMNEAKKSEKEGE